MIAETVMSGSCFVIFCLVWSILIFLIGYLLGKADKPRPNICGAIQCPDDDCPGCLVEGNVLGDISCNECDTKYRICEEFDSRRRK